MRSLAVTALGAVTMLFIGIRALQFRLEEVQQDGLTGNNLDAMNLTADVATGMTSVAGNALPRLFIVVIVVAVIMMLLMTR